jgi:magnesium transporter
MHVKRRFRHPLHLFPGRFTAPGTAPGDLTGPPESECIPTTLHLIDYDAGGYTEKADCTLEEAREYFSSTRSTWLHVNGTPSEALLLAIGDAYRLHPLALEDVLHTGQRAKLETYDAQLFTIIGLPELSEHGVTIAQLSLFLGDTWLVSFYSGHADPFNAIRQRTYRNSSRIRQGGVDYLYYSLLDTAVDLVFPILEVLGDRIETLELTVFDDPSRSALDEIHKLRRELVLLRRMTWPQRDMFNSLLRDEHSQIRGDTKLYVRDCYDHAVHVLDLVESYREMASSLLEVYLSSLSKRMNDVMKLLTIIATVFIPLSFIVGVYGMNFDRSVSAWNMPELGWRFGYPALWFVMVALVAGMLAYFRRKNWM